MASPDEDVGAPPHAGFAAEGGVSERCHRFNFKASAGGAGGGGASECSSHRLGEAGAQQENNNDKALHEGTALGSDEEFVDIIATKATLEAAEEEEEDSVWEIVSDAACT